MLSCTTYTSAPPVYFGGKVPPHNLKLTTMLLTVVKIYEGINSAKVPFAILKSAESMDDNGHVTPAQGCYIEDAPMIAKAKARLKKGEPVTFDSKYAIKKD